jgi:enoyl-[acyl-carrier protein] reductase I
LIPGERAKDPSMPFLQGRRILVTGMLSNRSIAYGIAGACAREGAELAFTYQGVAVRERVLELAGELGSSRVFPCDVAEDAQIEALFEALGREWDALDGLVHAIAFAPREALKGAFHESTTREAFRIAHDVSSYSLAALARGAAPLMRGRRGAIVTLSYLGAERAVPNYNVMGLAKASLEAGVRYLAGSLGPEGIRVNAISAGPIKTLAAAGIGGFSKILHFVEKHAPLRRGVTIHEVGNTAAFLLSDLASGITGDVIHVDAGFSITTAGLEE